MATVRATAACRATATPAETAGAARARPDFTDAALLKAVADGLTDQEIAAAAELSVETVRDRLVALYRRIGVADRTQAAIYALTKGVDALDD